VPFLLAVGCAAASRNRPRDSRPARGMGRGDSLLRYHGRREVPNTAPTATLKLRHSTKTQYSVGQAVPDGNQLEWCDP